MVRGISDITAWFEQTDMPYWRIYPHKGISSGNIVIQSKQVEEQSAGDALEQLKHNIKVLDRGYYTLAAFPEPNKLPTKGYHWVNIELPEGQQTAFPAAINGPAGISPDEVTKRINDALNAYKTEQLVEKLQAENADLKKANKELEKTTNEPMNRAIGAITPYLPQIMGSMFPAAQQVAGMPPADKGPTDNHIQDAEVVSTDASPEELEAINEFMTTLAAADPDYLVTLRRLTAKIKEQPSMIQMVKNFI